MQQLRIVNFGLALLSFLVCIDLIAINWRLGIVDPFLHGKISDIILTIQQGSLDLSSPNVRYTPGLGVILSAISLCADLSPRFVEYLPLCGLLFYLAVFCLAKRVTSDTVVSSMLALVVVARWAIPFQSGTWPHAFGYSLYLLAITLCFVAMPKKKLRNDIALWTIFLGIHVFSYNAELWLIAFLVLLYLIRYRESLAGLGNVVRNTARSGVCAPPLIAAMAVIFSVFNQAVLLVYIPKVEAMSGFVGPTFSYYLSMLLRGTPPNQYLYVPESSPFSLMFSNLLWFMLVIVPVFLIVLKLANRFTPRKKVGLHLALRSQVGLIVSASFLVMFVDWASYIPIGAVTVSMTRYFVFIGPMVSAFCIGIMIAGRRRSDVLRVYTVILAFVSVLIFFLTVSSGFYVVSDSKYACVDDGAEWTFLHTGGVDYVFSDHHTQGQYAIVAAENGLSFRADNLYTVESYEHLVDSRYVRSYDAYYVNEYVVINLELMNMKTTAGGWADLAPIGPYVENIMSNVNLASVYDDGRIVVMYGH